MQLVDNLVVGTSALYSQAVNMNGANAVQPTVVITNYVATTLTIVLEGSNDLSNWATITTNGDWSGLNAAFKAPTAQGGIAFQYVRLKLTASAAGLVCSVFLCTSFL